MKAIDPKHVIYAAVAVALVILALVLMFWRPGSSQLSVSGPKWVVDEDGNPLYEMVPIPTPTPPPSPSPSPTPSASPTPGPSPTPSPSATPSAPPAGLVYADSTLTQDKCNSYNPANRTCSGGSAQAFKDLQTAAASLTVNGIVQVRGGTFQQPNSAERENYIVLSGSGARKVEAYPGEKPIIRGRGYEDGDKNGDGLADGPADGGDRTNLLQITGNDWFVHGLTVENSSWTGILIAGNNNTVEEVVSQDAWMSNCSIRGNRNTVRFTECARSRHQTGLGMSPNDALTKTPTANRIESCLFPYGGHMANGNRVLPAAGDPYAGGNSDGAGSSKACEDYCPSNVWVGNISYGSTDDCFDSSTASSPPEAPTIWRDNIAYGCGPTGGAGWKFFAHHDSLVVGNVSLAVDHQGIEYRIMRGMGRLYHSTVLRAVFGQVMTATEPNSSIQAWNNLANGNRQFVFTPQSGTNAKTNSTATGALMNNNFTPNFNFPAGQTVRYRVEWLRDQFVQALSPKAGSPLIDKGTFIPDVHCATADDAPNPPAPGGDCRHWRGSAPDIGAYEYVP